MGSMKLCRLDELRSLLFLFVSKNVGCYFVEFLVDKQGKCNFPKNPSFLFYTFIIFASTYNLSIYEIDSFDDF